MPADDGERMKRLQGIRTRLLSIVLVALLPASLLFVVYARQQRVIDESRTRDDLRQRLELRIQVLDRLLEQARATLVAVAGQPDVRRGHWDDTHEFVRLAADSHPEYRSVGLARLDGTVVAASDESLRALNVGDRVWFERVVESKRFSIGTYQVGRLSNVPILVMGYPVLDGDNEVTAVAFVSMPVSTIKESAAEVAPREGYAMVVMDSEGQMLARLPDDSGYEGIGSDALVREVLERREGTLTTRDPDGVTREYYFDAAARDANGDMYVAVGFDPAHAFAESRDNESEALINLAFVTLFALFLAYTLSGSWIVAPLNSLVGLTRRIGAGEFTARAEVPNRADEFGDLAEAIDSMAGKLSERMETLEHRGPRAVPDEPADPGPAGSAML